MMLICLVKNSLDRWMNSSGTARFKRTPSVKKRQTDILSKRSLPKTYRLANGKNRPHRKITLCNIILTNERDMQDVRVVRDRYVHFPNASVSF